MFLSRTVLLLLLLFMLVFALVFGHSVVAKPIHAFSDRSVR